MSGRKLNVKMAPPDCTSDGATPRRIQTIERLNVTVATAPPDPDEWTCDGQADLLDELEATP